MGFYHDANEFAAPGSGSMTRGSVALLILLVAAPLRAQDDPLPARAVMRLGSTRWMADSAPFRLAFSHDDAFLYSSGDSVVKWNVKTGERVASWPASFGDLLDVSADGRWLVLGSSERQPRLIDATN